MVERQWTRFVTQLAAIIPVVPDETFWHLHVAFYTSSEKMTPDLIYIFWILYPLISPPSESQFQVTSANCLKENLSSTMAAIPPVAGLPPAPPDAPPAPNTVDEFLPMWSPHWGLINPQCGPLHHVFTR
jgi:hypothetical protein